MQGVAGVGLWRVLSEAAALVRRDAAEPSPEACCVAVTTARLDDPKKTKGVVCAWHSYYLRLRLRP
jgi:hypothetical protein